MRPITAIKVLIIFIFLIPVLAHSDAYFIAIKDGSIYLEPSGASEIVGHFKKGDIFIFRIPKGHDDMFELYGFQSKSMNGDRVLLGFVLSNYGEIIARENPLEAVRAYLQLAGSQAAPVDNPKKSASDKIDESVKSPGSSEKTIYTGPRGGQYYYNSKGNKTYLKRK